MNTKKTNKINIIFDDNSNSMHEFADFVIDLLLKNNFYKGELIIGEKEQQQTTPIVGTGDKRYDY